MRSLKVLCERRLPYSFKGSDGSDGGGESGGSGGDSDGAFVDEGEGIVSLFPALLPDAIVEEFLESVRWLEDKGWMSKIRIPSMVCRVST